MLSCSSDEPGREDMPYCSSALEYVLKYGSCGRISGHRPSLYMLTTAGPRSAMNWGVEPCTAAAAAASAARAPCGPVPKATSSPAFRPPPPGAWVRDLDSCSRSRCWSTGAPCRYAKSTTIPLGFSAGDMPSAGEPGRDCMGDWAPSLAPAAGAVRIPAREVDVTGVSRITRSKRLGFGFGRSTLDAGRLRITAAPICRDLRRSTEDPVIEARLRLSIRLPVS